MLMIREGAARARRLAFIESVRAQLSISLVISVLLPLLLFYPENAPGALSWPAMKNSIMGAIAAVLIGLFLLRRVTSFPGTAAFSFIMPSYAASYAIVVTLLFFLRLDYSRLYIGLSFVTALLINYAINLWLERFVVPRFYAVPFGATNSIIEHEGAEWVVMTEPTVPEEVGVAIVADLRFDHDPYWERMMAEAALAGKPVYDVKLLKESLTGQVSIDHLSENSLGSLLPNLAYVKVKRLLDIVVGAVLLVLLVVPMIVVALVIRLDSRGPVLFRQERMGYRARPFMMIKFRTMRPRPAYEDQNAARLDAVTQVDDDRVTRVGRTLRRMRIDELPQLVNVLRGEMSLIGPRPEALALSRWYEAELPFYSYRHIVRPGLSGWAQVHQGHVTDLDAVHTKLKFDFYYIKNFSASLDILIALKTVQIVLSGFGSK